MAAGTFDSITFPFVIGHEGKWGNDRRDRGNWTSGVIGKGELKGTKYGVAAHAYPNLDIKNLTIDDARAIMKRDYAAKVAYDDQPPGVDVSAFDMAYNAGPFRSLALLKAALGVNQTASPKGLAGIAWQAPDKVAVIKGFAARRLAFYQGLKTFNVFGRGWTRRAAECEALSVKTWLQFGANRKPADAKKQLEAESKRAGTSAKKNGAGATATAGGDAAGGSQIDPASLDWGTIALYGAVAVGSIILILFFIHWFKAHRERSRAYAEQAKGA